LSHRFQAAPWSNLLKLSSALSTLLLFAVSYASSRVIPSQPVAHLVSTLVAVLPMLILTGSLLFVVNGYELDARELRVQRLLWQTRIPLAHLQDVSPQPTLHKGSLRIFGNGGMFSFTGWFYRRDVGRYRALITDWKQAVVLHTDTLRLVISPADPAAFVRTVHHLYPATTRRQR
jgi:hypothetical protein